MYTSEHKTEAQNHQKTGHKTQHPARSCGEGCTCRPALRHCALLTVEIYLGGEVVLQLDPGGSFLGEGEHGLQLSGGKICGSHEVVEAWQALDQEGGVGRGDVVGWHLGGVEGVGLLEAQERVGHLHDGEPVREGLV